jgi:hypothetical protein
MSEKISSELDYSPVVSNHSTVLYRTVAPQGANSLASNVTSSVGPTEFIIPPSCFNLAKSRLNFTIQLAAGGADLTNVINANTLTTISRITLYDSATNALWCDISNVNQYASLLVPACTDFKEYSTKAFRSTTPVTAANAADAITAARLVTVEDISKVNKTTNLTGDNGDLWPENPYFSRRQFYLGGTAGNAINALDISIPLSAFKMSVLSSDKVMYCPSNLVLQVYWAPNNNYAFKCTAADPVAPDTGDVSLTTAINISNISLTLANEGNLAIVSQIINKVMASGISLPIAYPTSTVYSSSDNATAHSYQLSLTRGYGNRILAIVTAPFTRSTVAKNNLHERLAGDTSQYNTFLNNVAIKSQAGFSIASSQDYFVANREYLEGSVIQSLGEYVLGEWVHIDGFFGEKPIKDVDQHEIDGLDVGAQSSTWQIQATTAAASYNWATIIIGQKQLSISNQGSMVQ